MLKFLKNKLLIIISLCSTFLFCIIFFQNFSISDSLPPPIPYIPLPALASFYNQNLIINSCDVSIVPGNVSDDTKMLQSFLDTTAPGKTLCLLSGTFNIKTATDSGDPLGIKIPSHIRLKLASDTILKAIPNNFSSYAVLQIIDQVDVLVDGGIIDGDISNFTNSRNGEWGMGINILGSSQITIRNITIKH